MIDVVTKLGWYMYEDSWEANGGAIQMKQGDALANGMTG